MLCFKYGLVYGNITKFLKERKEIRDNGELLHANIKKDEHE